MFNLSFPSDTPTKARPAVSADHRVASVQNRRRRQSLRLARMLALCALACFGCWSPSLAGTPDDEMPPSFSRVSGMVPLKHSGLWGSHSPRLSVLYQTSNGIGYDQGFWSMQSFIPFAHQCGQQVTFFDLHGLFNQDGALGGNFGVGKRVYLSDLQATFGGFVYYDYRDTGFNKFQQISPGLDVFGNRWELHANGYIPTIADTRQALPDQFRGFSLFLDRYESAMGGADIELGVHLPLLEQFQPKLFAGAYTFDASGRRDATGWKTRLEASPADAMGLAVSLQDDQVFGTTANFGVEFRVSGRSLLSRRPFRDVARGLKRRPTQRCARDYLAGSTRRLHQIVIDQEDGMLARDPVNGDPLRFLHVAAGGNSDGSFEDPYATLTRALADPHYLAGDVDVIYVRGGVRQSVIHTGDFTLMADTQLLSNGPIQAVATQLGLRMLPFSGIDPELRELPQILGTVNLAENTTLSGFNIRTESALGSVVGDGVVAVNIRDNVVFNAFGSGIFLQNINIADSAGRITIHGNQTEGMVEFDEEGNVIPDTGAQFAGIAIVDSTRFEGDISDNTLNGNSDSGLFVSQTNFVGNVDKNTMSENGFSGFALLSSNFDGNITNNTVNRNRFTGLEMVGEFVDDDNDGNRDLLVNTFEGTIAGNQIDGINTIEGVTNPNESRLFKVDPKTREGSVEGGTGEQNSFGINMQGLDIIDAMIADNQLNNHIWGGLFIQDSRFSGQVTNNVANNNFADGISVINSDFVGQIVNNIANGNAFGGIFVEVGDFTATTGLFAGEILNNITNFNGGQGILVTGGDGSVASGDISGNLAEGNGEAGIVVLSETFSGTLFDNVANFNGSSGNFDGIFLGSQSVDGDVSFNTAIGNTKSGLFIGNSNSAFIGNIQANTLDSNLFSGLDIVAGTFDGSILDNQANFNGGAGLGIIATERLTGNTSGNWAMGNAQRGIFILSKEFIGDVASNTVSQNGISGLTFSVSEMFDGFVFGNIAESNDGTGIDLFLRGDAIGALDSNIANMNHTGILVLAEQLDSFAVTNNIANNNLFEGIKIQIFAQSPILDEVEANDTLATAQNIDTANFVLDFDMNILDSTTIPHLTINGTGDGTFDFYSFTANAGSLGIFDIDFQNFDTELFLFDSLGNLLAENDDAINGGDTGDGTPSGLGSFIEHTFDAFGQYVIGVGKFDSSADSGSITGNAPESGDTYTLQISIEDHPLGSSSGNTLGVVDVVGNQLQGNNGGTGRELVVENGGNGTMSLLLDNNTSLNQVDPGQFNFDLLNTGGGQFELFDFGNSTNVGTVGSSDGSVTVP